MITPRVQRAYARHLVTHPEVKKCPVCASEDSELVSVISPPFIDVEKREIDMRRGTPLVTVACNWCASIRFISWVVLEKEVPVIALTGVKDKQ